MSEAKDYLRQVELCDKHINSKLEQIAQLRALATKITTTWQQDVVCSHHAPDIIGGTVAKIVDLEAEVNAAVDDYVNRKRAIAHVIEQMQDPDQVEVLYKRYFSGETLERIAEEMHMSYRNVCYIHGRALQTVERILGNGGDS